MNLDTFPGVEALYEEHIFNTFVLFPFFLFSFLALSFLSCKELSLAQHVCSELSPSGGVSIDIAILPILVFVVFLPVISS